MSTIDEPQTQVLVSIAARRVTRVGALTVHPSVEVNENWRWAVTAQSGGAIGKFVTREGAESYARAVEKLGDWALHPIDIAKAIPWAQAFYAKHRAAIEDARAAAWQIDQRHRSAPFDQEVDE